MSKELRGVLTALSTPFNSDETIDVELLGYGITMTATGGTPTQISFTATKTGNFPLIVTASHIAIAQIRVDPR